MTTLRTQDSRSAGERLRTWRLKRGYSQREAGEVIGIARQTISQIECGKYRPGRRYSRRIEEVTKGKIRWEHWGNADISKKESSNGAPNTDTEA